MQNIIPARITEAREARALSMADLADRLRVTRQVVSKYERGITRPSVETLQALSRELCFPLNFFFKQEAGMAATSSSLFFRSNANISKKVKTACRHQVKWVDEIKRHLEQYVDFLDQDVPVIGSSYEELSYGDIEELALSLRNKWELGDRPVGDLIGVLENRGIFVSQFPVNDFCPFKGVDAFSCWKGGSPYILYHPVQKSAVRTRFGILHELGHLLMHGDIEEWDAVKKTVVDFTDAQADRFAAAFLLPATSFPNEIHGTSLSSLEIIKRKWGVSYSTIIRRCETLELLSEHQINYLKRQMTARKYWYKEPLDDELSIKGPEMLKDSLFLLIDNRIIEKGSFLSTLALPESELEKICALPDEFFDIKVDRQKPVLKVIRSGM